MLECLKELTDLVVLNDEAHHVHDEGLTWSQSLLGIHWALPKGLALWLDFSATPKDQQGMCFPWTVCDYPLAQSVEDRIVKAPIIVTKEDDARQPVQEPDHVTRENVCEKYGDWIHAAVQRWQKHSQTFRQLGTHPVLFIMAEKNAYADAIGEYLWKTEEFGFKEPEVLVIHTDQTGEVTQKDLDKARQAARDIDSKAGDYFWGLHGAWVIGREALRFLCFELGLTVPRWPSIAGIAPSHRALVTRALVQLATELPSLHQRLKEFEQKG
jgi:type III restriction enzyme